MKLRVKNLILSIFYIIFLYLLADILFSNFYFRQSVDHKCYEHVNDGQFYKMRQNCFANMRLISSINSFKVYTDEYGFRFSGKKKSIKNKNIIFLGDSQTFGVGSDWENTFVGILENKYKKFNFVNLAVPSYSPTVYKYTLENFLINNKDIKKIFVFIDITDVADEATRWSTLDEKPILSNEKVIQKDSSFFTEFKKNNFKGLYLISSKLRSFSRKIRSSLADEQGMYKPVEGNPTGAFLYTNHDELTGCNSKEKVAFWDCGGVDKGLRKITNNIIKISKIAKKNDSEFYLIIMPWPDTLNYGQTTFNWESYTNNLCFQTNCNKVINLFPKFREIKENDKDWLDFIYLKNDIHLTKNGNKLVAQEIEINSF